mmetsp:Transcript_59725/g.129381  ORF Transcript_59725/g.129381 Transcript_59725/m.129381 type:complete len:611 (-) Transcript_59725:114-1946(-)
MPVNTWSPIGAWLLFACQGLPSVEASDSTNSTAIYVEAGFSPFPNPEHLNFCQIVFLSFMYGYILFLASNLISDGSELLLLVPRYASIVGSVVLPILGAVPDGMMVFFSGAGPDPQEQVSVGVGALAGSTVMLLSLPWFGAIWAGRVNIGKGGKPQYKRPQYASNDWEKLSPPGNMSLFGTGVALNPELKDTAKTMMMTMLGYLVIQIPSLFSDRLPMQSGESSEDRGEDVLRESKYENSWALLGLVVCITQFFWYLHQMWNHSHKDRKLEAKIAHANVTAIREQKLTFRGAMANFRGREWGNIKRRDELEKVLVDQEAMEEVQRMCKLLAPFFSHYDTNNDSTIDFDEFRMIFKDVNEYVSKEDQKSLFAAADTKNCGSIGFEEFVACFMTYATNAEYESDQVNTRKQYNSMTSSTMLNEAEDDDDEGSDSEEEDFPEDLVDLDPLEQQRRVMRRSLYKMGLGTALVLGFSDPMVDLMAEMAQRLDISPFYVSFVLAPMASNASEVVAATNYAKKRTAKSISNSLSTLLGAGVMNNTFCLGIFLALVYWRSLAWEFTAETLSIIIIELLLGITVLVKEKQTLFDGFVVLSYYFLPLFSVWFLENVCGLD